MHDILIKHYETVREEILTRMQMRQTAITLYLGFVATVLGLTVGVLPHGEAAALVIPFVSLGVFWMVRDHELGLACLNLWLKGDYEKYLHSKASLRNYPQWDSSSSSKKYGSDVLVSRFIGYGILFTIPSMVSLILFLSLKATLINIVIGVIGIILTMSTLVLIINTYRKRRSISTKKLF